MENPTAMWKFMAFSVILYITFLEDACDFFLPFGISVVRKVSNAKEKCICNQLDNECFNMGICLLVYVKEYLGWYCF